MSLFGIQISVMVHVLFGVLGITLAVALLVYVLNTNEKNIPIIRCLSLWTAVSICLAYLIGGWWYVVHYYPERDIIRAGTWKWAHTFFMEFKEHFFFALLFLSILLPIIAYRNDLMVPENRRLLLIVTSLVVLMGFVVDGSGAIISRAVIVGYMGR
jgi:heme/copper-type cytochrome/quinol oxidase subunit 2